MKFWQKIYLFSLLAFIIIFNVAFILVIERNHSKLLEQEMTSTLNENINIQASIDAIVPVMQIYNQIDYEKTVLTQIVNEYISQNRNQKIYIEITDENDRPIYSNVNSFTIPDNRSELDGLQADEIRYTLRDVGEQTLLFTSSLIDIEKKNYLFTYTKDVTHLYQERIDQYQLFIQMDIAACLIYMVIMYFVSKGLTRPIDSMIKSAKIIAQGDFAERVSLASKDELGTLANNFNVMANVVEDKISELERRNNEQERFIHHFTHELKTPLTSIIGYANYLRMTKYNEETFLDGLSVISSEARRLESLSFKLMDLILLREDHIQMEIRDLKEVVEELEPSLSMKAKEKQIHIKTEGHSCYLLLEKDLFQMAILNLVDNAINASQADSVITIRTYSDQKHVILEVIDQGIGITEEHLDKIFEPFYMADKARTRRHNGAGLGLSICHSVASLHHAVIKVDSKENQGTTVQIIFDKQEEVEE